MASEPKVWHLDEVSKHNNAKDCWLIISGKVYDVTKFLEDHPGGDEVLLAATGKDATEDFEDVGHSDSAKSMMEQYYIGDIDPSTIPLMPKYTLPMQEERSSTGSEIILKILQFLVPLLILGAAVGIHHYSK